MQLKDLSPDRTPLFALFDAAIEKLDGALALTQQVKSEKPNGGLTRGLGGLVG